MLIDLTLSVDLEDPFLKKALANADQQSPRSNGHIGTHLDTYLGKPVPTEFHSRIGKVFDTTGFGAVTGQVADAGSQGFPVASWVRAS
jgi:hypothetical protein